jgi:hypothetical protein
VSLSAAAQESLSRSAVGLCDASVHPGTSLDCTRDVERSEPEGGTEKSAENEVGHHEA